MSYYQKYLKYKKKYLELKEQLGGSSNIEGQIKENERSNENEQINDDELRQLINSQSEDMLAKLLLGTNIVRYSRSTGLYRNDNSPSSLPDLEYDDSSRFRFPTKQQTKNLLEDYSYKWFKKNINKIFTKNYSNGEKQLVEHIKAYWINNLQPVPASEDGTVRPFSELN